MQTTGFILLNMVQYKLVFYFLTQKGMELSLYMAQLLGVVLVVVGLSLLLHTSFYQKMYKKIVQDEVMLIFSGILALVIGTVIVLAHNVWESSWVVIITLFGWIALVKGVLLLLLPSETAELTAKWFKGKGLLIFAGLFYLILGLVLGYFGWFA